MTKMTARRVILASFVGAGFLIGNAPGKHAEGHRQHGTVVDHATGGPILSYAAYGSGLQLQLAQDPLPDSPMTYAQGQTIIEELQRQTVINDAEGQLLARVKDASERAMWLLVVILVFLGISKWE